MNQQEKRHLESSLVAMGLNGVNDPELLTVFAQVVEQFPGDRHWFFRGMINECEPEKRREMYYSLRPRFTHFVPLPLSTYEAQIAEEAGRLISHGVMKVDGPAPHSVTVGGEHFVPVDEAHATHIAVRLTCSKCTRVKVFVGKEGETMVDVLLAARKKGWVHDVMKNKEICPKCPAVRPTKGNA